MIAPLRFIPKCSRTVLAGALLTSVVAGVAGAAPAHAAVPVVLKAAPLAVAPGHGITLAGTDLHSTTSVVFLGGEGPEDDRPAASFLALSPKALVVQVPAEATSGPVQVTNADGTAAPSPAVTILQKPVIGGLSASVVKGKDQLTITGTDLGVKPKIAIAGKGASLVGVPGPTSATVAVPAGLPGGPAVLRLAAPGGAATGTVYIAPEIKGIKPAVGSTTGGYTAVLSGSGLTGAHRVTFDGVPATAVMPLSDKEVVVQVPAGVATLTGADVVVSTRSGGGAADSSVPVKFGYQPIPAVTALSPSWAPVDVEQTVTLSGSNLTADTVVTLGTTVLPATTGPEGTLAFRAPAAPKAAAVKFTVSNTAPNGLIHKVVVPFTYAAAPTVTKLVPATGPAGTPVVVSGTGFVPGTTARFGDAVADCAVVSAVALKCVTPAGSGAVNVTVDTPLGSAPQAPAPAVVFTVTDGTAPAPTAAPVPAPAVKSLMPAAAPIGANIAILGGELQRVTAVTFPTADGSRVAVTKKLLVEPKRLVVQVPAGAVSGEIWLERAEGAPVRSGAVRFTAVDELSISSATAIADRSYAVVGGDTVVVRGTGLMTGAIPPVVTVGGLPASVLKVPARTATTFAVKVPVAIGGRAPVRVTTPFGTAEAPADLYYAPEIKTAKPVLLPGTEGARAMVISGLGFTGAHQVTTGSGRLSAVTFGGRPAAEVVVMNDKTMYAVPPTQAALFDPLRVTTEHQGWSGNSAADVTPLDLTVPTVSAVSPSFVALGEAPSAVTITGTNLGSDTAVRFGSTAASVVSVADDGTSMVVIPPSRSTAAKVSVTVSKTIDGQQYSDTVANGFGYLPIPTVTGLAPADGVAGAKPADVTISGTNLLANSVVRFGDTQATVVSAAADGTSMVVAPPVKNEPGTVDLTVVNHYDNEKLVATVTNGYDYALGTASVTGLSATTAAPGTQVTITGTSFRDVSSVKLGGTAVAFTVANPTTIYATIPVTPTGLHGSSVPVSVVNGTGNPSTGNHSWTWDAKPMITGMSARAGAKGSTVRLTGTGFSGTTAVRIGGTDVPTFTVVNDTALDVVVPSTPSGGTVDVKILARGLISVEPSPESTNDWTWAPIAAVTTNSTRVAPAAEGATVTVTGSGFTSGQTVKIEASATVIIDVSASVVVAPDGRSFTFTMPPRPGGTTGRTDKPLWVTNNSGTKSLDPGTGGHLISWS